MGIEFFAEGVEFNLSKSRSTSSWIKKAIKNEGKKLATVSFIFCNDEFLLKLNIQYLNHDTYTDVITFDYSVTPNSLSGEIYISVDRVSENAAKFKKTFDEELHRVIIHGILHLLGYHDKSRAEKALMREKEEAYLSLR